MGLFARKRPARHLPESWPVFRGLWAGLLWGVILSTVGAWVHAFGVVFSGTAYRCGNVYHADYDPRDFPLTSIVRWDRRRLVSPPFPADADVSRRHVAAFYGFPLWCMAAIYRVDSSYVGTKSAGDRSTLIAGIPLGRELKGNTPPLVGALPVVPYLPTLSFNAIVFGFIPAVWHFAIVERRVRRRRKNQCIACGYPLTTLPICPECGLAASTAPPVATIAPDA